jgi:hypothetical protein
MIDPRLRRDPQRFNAIEASIAESSDLKVCSVFIVSKENVSKGSVGQGTRHEFPFPWITLRRTTVLPLGVLLDETLEQLAHGLTVDFIPR